MTDTITDLARKAFAVLTGASNPRTIETICPLDAPYGVVAAIPDHMREVDLTDRYEKLSTKLQPWRRTGTAQFQDLESLIAWANRNKGATSMLFANVGEKPSITCIADYHAEGEPIFDHQTRDPKASHCRHRGLYTFPLSQEWRIWTGRSGKPMGKAELGEFIEANAKDMLIPSPALLNNTATQEDWEKRMQMVAQQVRGRFGTPDQLITISRRFEVYETNNITTTRNPDTGETSFVFLNEHKAPDGNPIQLANLFMIGIPAFDNGALYRLPVRFRYSKQGPEVKFTLMLHNPELALRDAVEEALTEAATATGLPLLRGTPEAQASGV